MLIRYTYIFLIKFLVIFLDFHWFFLKSDFSLVIGTRVAKNSANIAISEITLVPKQRQYSVFVFPQIHADFKYFVTSKFSLKSMSQLEM